LRLRKDDVAAPASKTIGQIACAVWRCLGASEAALQNVRNTGFSSATNPWRLSVACYFPDVEQSPFSPLWVVIAGVLCLAWRDKFGWLQYILAITQLWPTTCSFRGTFNWVVS